MDRLRDRYYGLLVGGAIGESIGASGTGAWGWRTAVGICLAKGLLEGSEPLEFYNKLCFADEMVGRTEARDRDPDTVTVCHQQDHVHTCNCMSLVRAGVVALRYFEDYESLLQVAHMQSLETHECALCAEACKLFASVLDSALHGRRKNEILASEFYGNLSLNPSFSAIWPGAPAELTTPQQPLAKPLNAIKVVLSVFKQTNNFTEGLTQITAETGRRSDEALLYGQLAGAYYGLTDIKESLIDQLERGDALLDMADALLADLSEEVTATAATVAATTTNNV